MRSLFLARSCMRYKAGARRRISDKPETAALLPLIVLRAHLAMLGRLPNALESNAAKNEAAIHWPSSSGKLIRRFSISPRQVAAL